MDCFASLAMTGRAFEQPPPQKRRAAPFGNGSSIVVARASSPGLVVTCLWRTLRAQILRGGKNPGPVDHTGLMTMRHWITSFRLLTTGDMLYQSAYSLTHAQFRWPMDWILSGSSMRKRQASTQASTISS